MRCLKFQIGFRVRREGIYFPQRKDEGHLVRDLSGMKGFVSKLVCLLSLEGAEDISPIVHMIGTKMLAAGVGGF